MRKWEVVEIKNKFHAEVIRMNQEGYSKDYINQWKKENTRIYRLQLNKLNDADLIEILENESNKAAFIKDCIRKVVASTTKQVKCILRLYV